MLSANDGALLPAWLRAFVDRICAETGVAIRRKYLHTAQENTVDLTDEGADGRAVLASTQNLSAGSAWRKSFRSVWSALSNNEGIFESVGVPSAYDAMLVPTVGVCAKTLVCVVSREVARSAGRDGDRQRPGDAQSCTMWFEDVSVATLLAFRFPALFIEEGFVESMRRVVAR